MVSLEKLTGKRVRVTLASGVFVVPEGALTGGTDSADGEYLEKLQLHGARTDAQRFLEYSERSTGQLKKKLTSLGYSESVSLEIVEWAEKYGFVNDVRFSELFIKSRTMGKLRLRVELLKRGVNQAAVEQVLSGYSDLSEFDEVVASVRKKYGGIQDRERALRRAAGWLQRRGYSGEFIHRVLTEAM